MKKISALLTLVAAIFLLPGTASAGCNINVGVKNSNASSIDVKVKLFSAVKTKNGAWRNLQAGHWGPGPVASTWTKRLAPGQTYKDNYSATFGCKKNRQYRIRYDCGDDSSVTTYYPSGTSFTKKTTFVINLDGC